jgi:hypothetical protein
MITAPRRLLSLSLLVGSAALAGCSSSTTPGTSPSPKSDMSTRAPSPDPRVGLRGGMWDTATKTFSAKAAEAAWNLNHVSNSPTPAAFAGVTNSDLAFMGKYAIQGNYNGYQVWDVSNPRSPVLATSYVCPASQSDVSVYKNLLFVSAEAPSARLDCGKQGVTDSVSKDRIRGVRIFDATDIMHPKYLTNVQTCRGSHTHTVVHDPNDPNNVYIYISGTSGVRSPTELPGCIGSIDDPNTALFRIEVIKVPLAHPEQAAIVSSPRIFANEQTGAAMGLVSPGAHGASPADTTAEGKAQAAAAAEIRARAMAARGGAGAAGGAGGRGGAGRGAAGAPGAPGAPGGGRAAGPPRGTLTQCHDITVYPAMGLAGGACAGMGLLLDIKDVAHPKRIDAYADSNFSFWHSATFSNDGKKVLFSDEWGGGGAAYCRKDDPKNWGADALFNIVDGKLKFAGYYKMPAAQTWLENCVAHNGSLIPIPGRDVMVQSFYQGGITVFDWTDAAHPVEIAFFDRGPNDSREPVGGGFWSSYWYNGLIVGSEEKRGLDVFELKPSGFISQNELDAAKSAKLEFLNVQDQPHYTWPATFSLARAYLDQLERNKGLASGKISETRAALSSAEKMSGAARADALTKLSTSLHTDARSAGDQPKAHTLASAVGDLAKAQH